jgi:hypothetical protein
MPPQLIMHGMPMAIIAFMALQRSCIIAIPDASIGRIVQVIPSFVISHVTRHIIGIAIIGMPMPIAGMAPPIIGMLPIIGIMPGMPPIMPGIPPIIPGMPPIIGIIPFIIGFIMPMPPPIIGMGIGIIIGIIGMPPDDGLIPLPIIGIALIGVIATRLQSPAPAGSRDVSPAPRRANAARRRARFFLRADGRSAAMLNAA